MVARRFLATQLTGRSFLQLRRHSLVMTPNYEGAGVREARRQALHKMEFHDPRSVGAEDRLSTGSNNNVVVVVVTDVVVVVVAVGFDVCPLNDVSNLHIFNK